MSVVAAATVIVANAVRYMPGALAMVDMCMWFACVVLRWANSAVALELPWGHRHPSCLDCGMLLLCLPGAHVLADPARLRDKARLSSCV